jgi:hypothetical protein
MRKADFTRRLSLAKNEREQKIFDLAHALEGKGVKVNLFLEVMLNVMMVFRQQNADIVPFLEGLVSMAKAQRTAVQL